MCGRFTLKSPPAEVGALFGVALRDNFPPRYNICPSQPVAAIYRNERRERTYGLMRWGFIPSWAKGERLADFAARPLINARSETVAEKASFRSAFKHRRCLVPADGFYEWRGRGDGAKQPYAISRADGGLFALAGIWETAVDAEGGEIDTLAILTTASGPDLKTLHAREPVVIARDQFAFWLAADARDLRALSGLLTSAPADTWSAHAVSMAVNSPRNDGPALLAPLAGC